MATNSIASNIEALDATTTNQPLAEAAGATSQQVTMTGTDAQKKATMGQRIDSAYSQQQELFRAERLKAPRMEETVQERLAKERQEKLAGLGNIGRSIQNTLSAEFQKAGEAATGKSQVSESYLAQVMGLDDLQLQSQKDDPNSKYNMVKSTLQQFLESGDPNTLENVMAGLDNLGIRGYDATRLIGLTQDLIAKQTGQTVATNIMDQLTLGDVNIQELGFDQGIQGLAETLDIDPTELAGMTIPQLQDMIETKRNSEFARIDKLKAELAAAPIGSSRREILLRELKDLGQVGVTGVEAAAAETAEDIDLAQYVDFAGEKVKIEDLLDDEQLSNTIMDFINEKDPVRKDELLPPEQYQGLRDWIDANQRALAELSETAGDTIEQYEQANDEYKGLGTLDDLGISIDDSTLEMIIPGYDPSKSITSKQLEDIRAQLGASSFGQIYNDQELPKDLKKSLINDLGQLSEEDRKALLQLPPQNIKDAYNSAKAVEDTPGLSDFLGLDSGNKFFTDPEQKRKIAEYKDIIAKIQEDNPTLLNSSSLAYKVLQNMSPEELKRLNDNPNRYKDIEAYANRKNELNNIKTDGDKLSFVFGNEYADLDQINTIFQEAAHWAKFGDRSAQELVNEISDMFGRDPSNTQDINMKDVDNLIYKMRQGLSLSNYGLLAGKLDKKFVGDRSNEYNGLPSTVPNAYAFPREILGDDGVISADDLTGLSDTEINQLQQLANTNPNISMDLNGFDNYKDYQRDQEQERVVEQLDATAESNGFGSVGTFYDWMEKGGIREGISKDYSEKLYTFREEVTAAANSLNATPAQKEVYNDMLADIDTASRQVNTILAKQKADEIEPYIVDLKNSVRDTLIARGEWANWGDSAALARYENEVLPKYLKAAIDQRLDTLIKEAPELRGNKESYREALYNKINALGG